MNKNEIISLLNQEVDQHKLTNLLKDEVRNTLSLSLVRGTLCRAIIMTKLMWQLEQMSFHYKYVQCNLLKLLYVFWIRATHCCWDSI